MRSNMVGKSVLSVNATYLLLLQPVYRFHWVLRLSATYRIYFICIHVTSIDEEYNSVVIAAIMLRTTDGQT